MSDNASANQLKLFIERLERLEEERKGIGDDIRDVYAEAKATGFDIKTIKKLLQLRAMDTASRQEAEALLETYRAAIGLDGEFTPDPADDPKALAARNHILAALIQIRQGTVIKIKAALTDKAAKALTYTQIIDHLQALVEAGNATIDSVTGGFDVYRSANQ